MPWMGCHTVGRYTPAPVDLHSAVVTVICAELGHFARRQRLRDSVGAGLRVLGVPQPSGFAGPQLVEACPVVAGPAALCGRAGCVGFGLRGGRVP